MFGNLLFFTGLSGTTRNKTKKRKYYRYVAKEKRRLTQSGADPEEVRFLVERLAVDTMCTLKEGLKATEKSVFQVLHY